MKYLSELLEQLLDKGIELKPCSLEEVEEVQKNQLQKLPESYVEYLTITGRGCGNNFLRGHSCFINEIPHLKKWSTELLQENGFPIALTELDYVFWMSQGYQFAFFKLDEGENPPVYYYREGSNQSRFAKISNSFSEFLLRILNGDRNLFDIEKKDNPTQFLNLPQSLQTILRLMAMEERPDTKLNWNIKEIEKLEDALEYWSQQLELIDKGK